MSDRLSAIRNHSHFALGAHTTFGSHTQRPPLQRYGAGIAMVLLVHAGAIVAIKSGLDIRDFIRVEPPLIAIPIPLPPKIEKPIERIEVKLTGSTPEKMPLPVLPMPPDVIAEEPPPPVHEQQRTDERAVARDPEIAEAQADPRHPLTQPDYPSYSQKLGEEGRVQLLVFVLPNGRVGEAKVAVSSGFKRLDEAALREALRSWRFLPNTVDGVPTGSWNQIAITFRMKR